MASNTPRVGFYMPADDGSEPLNVATDINSNLQKIDSNIGFVPATESTPPPTPYNGMARYNTDTGKASFWRSATSTWTQILTAGVSFASNLLMDVSTRIGIGTTTPAAMLDVTVTANVTTTPFITYKRSSDTYPRLQVDHDGMRLGPGTTGPSDVRIYRPTTNQLSIQGSVSMDSGLAVTGATQVDNLTVTGSITGGTFASDVTVPGNLTVNTSVGGTGIGVLNIRRRTTDLARASNVTATVDSAFDYPLDANSTYFVEMFICYAGLNTADFKCSWNVPSGASGPRWCFGMPASPTDASSTSVSVNTTGFGSDWSYGTQTATAYAGAQETLTITTSGTAGTLQFKWAQAATSTTATTLRAGSIMRVTKVA